MKNSTFTLIVAAIAMTLSLGQASFAQTGSDNASSSSGNTTTVRTEEQRNDGPDMGWLGLLGLAGLAGLLKKPERQVVHDTTVRTQNPPDIQNR